MKLIWLKKVKTIYLDEQISKNKQFKKNGTENNFQMLKLCMFEKKKVEVFAKVPCNEYKLTYMTMNVQ